MIRPTLVLLFVLGLGLPLRAQDAQADVEKNEAAKRLATMKEQPRVYDFRLGKDESARLKLEPEPVLRWDNPVSRVKDGTVFIWTHNGRPEIAAQVFLSSDGKFWIHEFQSLSVGRLVGQWGERRFWRPAKAAIEPVVVPKAPAPAGSATRRLVQMRSIAKAFSAAVDFRVNPTDTTREHYELRLLPKPLHRYGKADSDILDGALFAFVQGTNPEVLLLLEARSADGGYRWTFGLAPMTGCGVEASRDGKMIWSVPEQKRPIDSSGLYWIHKFDS